LRQPDGSGPPRVRRVQADGSLPSVCGGRTCSRWCASPWPPRNGWSRSGYRWTSGSRTSTGRCVRATRG
jgi:hypothetical protein